MLSFTAKICVDVSTKLSGNLAIYLPQYRQPKQIGPKIKLTRAALSDSVLCTEQVNYSNETKIHCIETGQKGILELFGLLILGDEEPH